VATISTKQARILHEYRIKLQSIQALAQADKRLQAQTGRVIIIFRWNNETPGIL